MKEQPVHEQSHPGPKQYLVIFTILTIATLIEVIIFYLRMNPALMALILILISGLKFATVVGFYMHLKFDDRRFMYLFVAPFFIALSIMIVLLALFQSFTRHS